MAEKEARKKTDFSSAVRYTPDPLTGLDDEQVKERVANGFVNYDATVGTKSVSRIIIGHLMTLFNLVNIIIAIALVAVGSYKNLLFMTVITANVLIGIIQEIRAKKATDKLSFVARSVSTVIRNGAETKVPAEEIVLDDILSYRIGDQIDVDCVVVSGECEANESFVTGESDAVFKGCGETLLAGSFVSSGECRAKADKIADQSYISSISKSAKSIKAGRSVLMTSLKRVITILSCVIFPLGFFIFIDQYAITNSVSETVISTSAQLLSMIPQGLMLLTSTALALSVVKLSRHSVLVKDLYSVEMLARVDVVCLDKTGTLTEGRLNVEKLVVKDETYDPELLLAALASSLGKDNATMEAIGESYPDDPGYGTIKKIPFSSKEKWSGCVFEGIGSVVIGAAEYIMPGNSAVLDEAASYAGDYRVLLLCTSKNDMDHGRLPSDLRPAAFVLLRDKIRKEAPDLISYLVNEDVGVRIISGDNPVTVSAIAKVCGVPDAEKYVDCSTLKTEKDIKKAAAEYVVFGRVTPFQKKQLILALKKKKHTVAMTGDGVNDVLAMKEADCSIAMGSGTDAARNVACLVLLGSDFDSLPHVIAEGRRSVNNIQRSASFFLTKTVYATLMAISFLLIHQKLPFQPIQQSLISGVCIGLPSVVLAFEPNHERIKGNFFGNVILRSLPGGITIAAAITLTSCLGTFSKMLEGTFLAFTVNPECIPTMSLYITGLISFLVLISICYPPNRLGKLLMAVVASLFIGGVIILGGLFEIAHLGFTEIMFTVVICALSTALMYLLTRASRRILYGRRIKDILPEE